MPVLLTPLITPRGHLLLADGGDPPPLDDAAAERLREAFARGPGEGLLQIGAGELHTTLPLALAFWRDVGGLFVTALCSHPDLATARAASPAGALLPPPDEGTLERLCRDAPPMRGLEYLSPGVLRGLWDAMGTAATARMEGAGASVEDVLREFDAAWHTVGRVHFHLAEHRKDPEAPFAFLATYTHGLSPRGTPQHLPLGQALRQYATAASKPRLLSLLVPVKRAAETCPWLKAMVDSGEVFHPLRWTPQDALAMLRDVPLLERAGVIVRMPASWKAGRPPRPRVTARVGSTPAAGVGMDALLDFDLGVTLGDETLTADEIRALLEGADGLVLLRGRWVEVDREQLRRVLDRFHAIDRAASSTGLSFADAMRLLSAADVPGEEPAVLEERERSHVVAGPWLSNTLRALREPGAMAHVETNGELNGTLRPYQQVGVRWLHLLSSLGLGACLADDMGLGKTIQVLSLLLARRRGAPAGASRDGGGPSAARRPSLLVAPASLVGNWTAEIARFAPTLRTFVAHRSATPPGELKAIDASRLAEVDLVITTYASVRTVPWLAEQSWDLVVADEAQAIKNPAARQTRAVKALRARGRIALTGTPIENRLGDLWSIFDFVNPGLLGSAKAFTAFTKRLAERPHQGYAPLRDLVRPYILRRLKTDRTVISDLPEKSEVTAYCLLARRQAALYAQTVTDLRDRLARSEGIERRGVVLAALTQLKQICNHPSHWLRDDRWAPAESGKFGRLAEIVETIAERQEKVLVFTQFREVTGPLSAYLEGLFGAPGLVLHGGTPVAARRGLVRRFQDDERVPFFVLSLKAGGTGLNLTAASHVVHFDRWWNPAVEDQATDRAFRIGQSRNVLVHKFVCRGTVEERIDELIAAKRGLAADLLEGGAELLLTEMNDEDLLRLVSLDVNAALEGA